MEYPNLSSFQSSFYLYILVVTSDQCAIRLINTKLQYKFVWVKKEKNIHHDTNHYEQQLAQQVSKVLIVMIFFFFNMHLGFHRKVMELLVEIQDWLKDLDSPTEDTEYSQATTLEELEHLEESLKSTEERQKLGFVIVKSHLYQIPWKPIWIQW